MCDLTQCVVTVEFSDILSATLSVSLFEYVLLKFGLCELMIIDDGLNFKGILTDVCECLKILVNLLAKRNATDIFSECFYRMLDRTTTIINEDRGRQ